MLNKSPIRMKIKEVPPALLSSLLSDHNLSHIDVNADVDMASTSENTPVIDQARKNLKAHIVRTGQPDDDGLAYFDPDNVTPDRPLTAYYNIPDKNISTKLIFDSLISIGIPANAVPCLQR